MPTALRAPCVVDTSQSFLLDRLQTPHARAGRAQACRLNRIPTNALSDHDPEGAQPSPSAQPTRRRGTARWRESREGNEMTHATTAPRTENAMKATMTANGTQGTCARALLGRIVGSLLLLAGLVTTVPAQAQTTCNAPDLSGRTQIWTNTVNVGTGTSGSYTVYGYSDASPVTGSLVNSANNMFGTHLSRTYRIRGVLTLEDAMGVKKLTMYVGNDLTIADRAKLSLHICGETFSLSTAQHHDGLDSYTWSNVTLDWSSEHTRTVYLSVSGGTTCSAPDLSGGDADLDEHRECRNRHQRFRHGVRVFRRLARHRLPRQLRKQYVRQPSLEDLQNSGRADPGRCDGRQEVDHVPGQ